jgi:microcystin-dependent protein
VTLNPASVQPAGNGVPHTNIQPYLALNYCISLTGIFPSRN